MPHQSITRRKQNQFDAIRYLELGEYSSQVVLYRKWADSQRLRDLFVALSLHDRVENVRFSGGESKAARRSKAPRRAEKRNQLFHYLALHPTLAFKYRSDTLEERLSRRVLSDNAGSAQQNGVDFSLLLDVGSKEYGLKVRIWSNPL